MKNCEFKLKSENLSKIHQSSEFLCQVFSFTFIDFSHKRQRGKTIGQKFTFDYPSKFAQHQKFATKPTKKLNRAKTEDHTKSKQHFPCNRTAYKINREESESKETKTAANKSRNLLFIVVGSSSIGSCCGE